jgi:hypothetical protein
MKISWRRVTVAAVLMIVAAVLYFGYPPEYKPVRFPDGKTFAFCIVDDTDGATLERIRPVYDLFGELGIRSTKTIWVLPTNDSTHWPNRGVALDDSAYMSFLLGLKAKGSEIALHGARGGNSTREETILALERFKNVFGSYPRIHINHYRNLDNLYWGADKLSVFPFHTLYSLIFGGAPSYGHDTLSEYFWGDIAKERISYVVNYSFEDINTLSVDPLIPYFDPSKPYVNYWFHSSDGGMLSSFCDLISKENVDRLEKEEGACFVYTHLASGFVKDGAVDSTFDARLRYLASKNGWFAPASEVLDYIRERRSQSDTITFRQRVHVEGRWLLEKALHGSR